jgi:hypothetical protein
VTWSGERLLFQTPSLAPVFILNLLHLILSVSMPLSAAEHEKKCLVLHPKLHPLYKETMRCLFTGQALARAPTCPQGLKNLSIPEKH